MLISAVMPIMSIYRLPHGQYGYKGHVINLPQDITAFATSLPRLTSELDVILVRKEGSANSHRDFRVRKSVVLRALQWLKQHNKYYHRIEIDHRALNLLPDDGNLTGLCEVMMEMSIGDEEEQQPTEGEDGMNPSDDVGSFVPVVARKITEEESIRKSLQERVSTQPDETVPWPPRGDTPINEFTTEGYISCAFPTLLPTGAADFVAPRQHAVTVGNYFKHLLMYGDGQFAKHPRFRYFALNTEMRWRALQTGRIFVNQHPKDARLTLDELRDMVGREGEFFSNRVLHYASSLRGTNQYWYKQRSRLISMVDDLGLPTVFFTHSAADGQWPELARLICPENQDSSSSRSSAVAENPAIADWFFYHRICKFIEAFYVKVLGAKDYWFRFEWQHRGSPHVHGLAWFENAPDIEQLLASQEESDLFAAVEEITSHVDGLVSTINPAIARDGSNAEAAPTPKTRPHVCNKPYTEVKDFNMDLVDLIATCQRHTRCSVEYCLRKKKGKQECRFGYPKPLQPVTTIVTEEGVAKVLTARNDCLLNSYNPVQLSAWRANVDMQYVMSRQGVINYVAKYATKPEYRSEGLKTVYSTIIKNLKDDGTPLKVVQKLMVNSVGARDYSAQETCHLLLQLPMYRASRDFVILSLDGSREVDDKLDEGQVVTVDSQLDHYCSRPTTPQFEDLTLLQFVQRYRIPKRVGDDLFRRRKEVVVIVRPYCSPDPNGPKYEQYSKQRLMTHQPFRQLEELLGVCDTHSEAYSLYLQTGTVPPSLADDIHRLETAEREDTDADEVSVLAIHNYDITITNKLFPTTQEQHQDQNPSAAVQDWMLICQYRAEFTDSTTDQNNCDWSLAAMAYPNLQEMPSFIAQQRQQYVPQAVSTTANPDHLQGKQLDAYRIVHEHFKAEAQAPPLRMIVSGTAGTGKSYLIQCLKLLLGDRLRVTAPTGVAAFNVNGYTLHSLFCLPVKGDFKALEGKRLQTIQQSMAGVDYIIIDEMSMVGRKMFGQLDRRLRQVFPHRSVRN